MSIHVKKIVERKEKKERKTFKRLTIDYYITECKVTNVTYYEQNNFSIIPITLKMLETSSFSISRGSSFSKIGRRRCPGIP